MNKKYRKAIIAGNWKMNKLASEVKPFIEELKMFMPKEKTCETVLCVPFPLIPAMVKTTKDTRISAGAQDVSAHDKGAYTGEVSADMLKDIGAKYVIVGHSERRGYWGESDSLINTKVHALVNAGMTPIICCGESLEQRQKDLTMEHISYQVKAALYGLDEAKARKCVIAYEPIWAIGTGETATSEQAETVCLGIRNVIREMYGARSARSMSILYGGSMNANNAAELLAQPDIDGGLIGGASLKPADFSKIIEATAK